jgi:hypothetical protein
MLRQLLLTVLVAAVTSVLMLRVANPVADTTSPATDALATQAALQSSAAPTLSISTAPEEDAWLEGMGADGRPRPGPADDIKPLVSAENSVCFLTDVQVKGMNDASDQLACRVAVDEFTGFWELHAVQGEGTDASVRCNARCLSIH